MITRPVCATGQVYSYISFTCGVCPTNQDILTLSVNTCKCKDTFEKDPSTALTSFIGLNSNTICVACGSGRDCAGSCKDKPECATAAC